MIPTRAPPPLTPSQACLKRLFRISGHLIGWTDNLMFSIGCNRFCRLISNARCFRHDKASFLGLKELRANGRATHACLPFTM